MKNRQFARAQWLSTQASVAEGPRTEMAASTLRARVRLGMAAKLVQRKRLPIEAKKQVVSQMYVRTVASPISPRICRTSATIVLKMMGKIKLHGFCISRIAPNYSYRGHGICHLSEAIVRGGFAGGGACVEILVLQRWGIFVYFCTGL